MKNLILLLLLFTGFNIGIGQTSLTKNHDLVFGNIIAGNTSNIPVTDANVAKFVIQCNNKNNLDISFVLPATLTSAGNPNIPVTFDINHTSYRKTTNDPNGSTFINPYSTLHLNPVRYADLYYVWIGGIASPPTGTPPATYTATITINTTQY